VLSLIFGKFGVRAVGRNKRVDRLLRRFTDVEEDFLHRDFFAPVVRGGQVRVGIAHVMFHLRVLPGDFEGYGIFRPISYEQARLVNPASSEQRLRYLELFPALRLVLCRQMGDSWLAVPIASGDHPFQIQGLVPVDLVEHAWAFDVIGARFDGTRCLFDYFQPDHHAETSAALRGAMQQAVDPDEIQQEGLLPEQRVAYVMCYAAQDTTGGSSPRLRAILASAGPGFLDYPKFGNTYRILYNVNPSRRVSIVAKHEPTARTAGVCLDDSESNFDLKSLTGVIHRAGRNGRLAGMNEAYRWRKDVQLEVIDTAPGH